jgi:hypothetical protein
MEIIAFDFDFLKVLNRIEHLTVQNGLKHKKKLFIIIKILFFANVYKSVLLKNRIIINYNMLFIVAFSVFYFLVAIMQSAGIMLKYIDLISVFTLINNKKKIEKKKFTSLCICSPESI